MSRDEFMATLPEAGAWGEDKMTLVLEGIERIYTFTEDRLTGITVHPVARVSAEEARATLNDLVARHGQPAEHDEDVYSDRVRQDSEHRWHFDRYTLVLSIASFNDTGDYALYEERRLSE